MALDTSLQEEFRSLLERRKSDLEAVRTTGEESAATVELDQSRVGRLSRMEAMQAQAVSRETNRRRGVELQRIDAALQRLHSGSLGICQACGDDIDPERLRLDPAAPVCVSCARGADTPGG